MNYDGGQGYSFNIGVGNGNQQAQGSTQNVFPYAAFPAQGIGDLQQVSRCLCNVYSDSVIVRGDQRTVKPLLIDHLNPKTTNFRTNCTYDIE